MKRPHKMNVTSLTQKLHGKNRYGDIIGNSAPMQAIYHLLDTITNSDSTVLISGETGTGKELIANAIHLNSRRKDGPMVSVNCGAIPKELMEREFFGHIKGAYTGAYQDKKGYFEEAHGGTIFLDEIGELDKDLQVKLLRILERGEIIRVGETQPTTTDTRLIAATNKDLRTEVRQGNFRKDLYYRIYVIPIHVSPLRERKADIPLLVDHFVKKFQLKLQRELPCFSTKEMELFVNYSYPGNVRELENIIERFCLLGTSVEQLLQDLPKNSDSPTEETDYDKLIFSSSNPLKEAAHKAKLCAERDLIRRALKICDNNYSETAKLLNISLSSLYRKLKEGEEQS